MFCLRTYNNDDKQFDLAEVNFQFFRNDHLQNDENNRDKYIIDFVNKTHQFHDSKECSHFEILLVE